MNRFPLLALTAVALAVASHAAPEEENWPSFRGVQASGLGSGKPTPTTWNVESGENVKWKAPIPGLAHSSPIVWGDRVYVTSAVSESGDNDLKVGLYGDIAPVDDPSEYSWRLYALDKASGELLWMREAHRGVPKVKRHTKATHANSTPATDGKRVVAFFGSEGLHAWDMDGEPLWSKDLGTLDAGFFRVPAAQWGFGSSPILVDEMVVVQCDVQGQSYVAAFEAATGKQIWRTDRFEVPTWGSPTVYEVAGRKVVAVNGWKHIGGYDLQTGAEVWRFAGGGDIPTPTPIVAHDMVFITNAHGNMAPIYAVRKSAEGVIDLAEGESTSGGIAWSTTRDGAYMQTPIVVGDLLYVCRDNGVVGCYRAKTGEEVYRQRLGKGGTAGFSASAVSADGKIYFSGETGEVYVVRAGEKYELLAVNEMDEILMATPAISDGVLFFRTRGHIVAVGE
jgi:outer membrane protein assembly factor BamB